MAGMRYVLVLLAVLGCGGDGGSKADAGAVPDAGDADAGMFPGVGCGELICDPPELCCTTEGAQGCVTDAPGACEGGELAACDGPEDCDGAGEICCGVGGAGRSTSCTTLAACTGGLPRCHGPADCGGVVCCPQGFCGPGCD
jgi:hypothetical protein